MIFLRKKKSGHHLFTLMVFLEMSQWFCVHKYLKYVHTFSNFFILSSAEESLILKNVRVNHKKRDHFLFWVKYFFNNNLYIV